ncbi:unnamed protein product, partial [Symbiodinium sp. KB8]
MGASMPASETAPGEPTNVDNHAAPTAPHSQADPSTTPIPEEPNLTFLAQQEWYDSQDKIFQGPIPPDTPWQDDDLSAQPSSSASAQPMASQQKTSPQAPDAEAWLLPKPDTCLYNIFGEPFQLRDIKEKIAKGQMPHCLYKDPKAVDEQPLNRQEMWAAMQFKPIYRTAGRWTYYDLLPDDIRKPPPQFCDEIEDAPLLPPASRPQPKEKARPKHVPPSARPTFTPKSPQKDSWADATEEEAAAQPAPPTKPQPAQPPKTTSETTPPTEQPPSSTTEQKSEPPPQQHLRPPESQSFLPKDSEPLPKPMPKKPSQASTQPQGQATSADRPGSSQDNMPDLSASDPASVYQPQSGQDIDLDAIRSLDQPGASIKPYVIDISLLDNRAQPLYSYPHYQPIECMIYDKRPWICFYEGSPPMKVAETDSWWYTMYDREGPADDTAQAQPAEFVRDKMPTRPPTMQISRDMQPEDMPSKKGSVVAFPEQPWVLEKPRLPTRVECKPLRGCLCLPAMVLPESYQVGPAFARSYYMGNDNQMHCLLPCSTEPFCPFHSACGRPMRPASLEHDDHKGHMCSRCKEFLDKGRSPFEWFDSLPEDITQESLHRSDPVQPLGLFTVKARPEGLISRASQETNRKDACLYAWQEILQALGSASSLHSNITASKYPEALLRKSLERFTAGTLERYIASTRQFLDFLGLSNRTVLSMDVSFLADFLHACENSLEEDREVMNLSVSPDFILPVLTNLGGLARPSSIYSQPMAYSQSLAAMRFAFLRPEPKYVPPKKPDSIKAITRVASGSPHSQGGALEPPFHVDRSQPLLAYQVSSFGDGVSRFVYSREADMEAFEPMERADDSQGSQDEPQPSSKTSQIPEDDAEALMVEMFANEAHSSSESDEEALETPK